MLRFVLMLALLFGAPFDPHSQTRPDLLGKWVVLPDSAPNELVVMNPGQPGTVKGPERVPSLGNEFELSMTRNILKIERQFQGQPVVVTIDLAGPSTANAVLGIKTVWTGRWEGSKLLVVERAPNVPEGATEGVRRTIWLGEDGTLKVETSGLLNRPVQITNYKRVKGQT